MTKPNAGQVKLAGWGFAAGAVVTMVIGFSWGGWVTATTADKMSDEAVLASRSAICVAQFMKAPNHDVQLKAFRDTDSWARSRFVEQGGWDKMPGEETARSYVSGACADGIEALLEN